MAQYTSPAILQNQIHFTKGTVLMVEPRNPEQAWRCPLRRVSEAERLRPRNTRSDASPVPPFDSPGTTQQKWNSWNTSQRSTSSTKAMGPGGSAAAAAVQMPDLANVELPRGTLYSPMPQAPLKQDSRPPVSNPPLAYELIQGALVRWSLHSPSSSAYSAPPTAVFIHGILGSRKNFSSFARRLAREFPSWQMLLVDLRCHGDSSSTPSGSPSPPPSPPHTVASAARDVLQLVRGLRLVPQVLVGHSFGGKVALNMVKQVPKPLAKPVQVWVLDATPGEVHAGGDGEDHPAELIQALANMEGPITDRKAVVSSLCSQGFSPAVAQWMTTNLRSSKAAGGALEWTFDLGGIAQMYASYEATDLWPLVESVPEGVRIEFLRAERSLHRWAHGDVTRISAAELRASAEGAGVKMHVLEDAGHWVHQDNPDGLFRILAPSFR